ncbi:hypothetical protein PCANC_18603 [Puccinia coronata f. sp. avenae]|uniref:Uncharacterized protein n=1 Tax=Puccinia coronata f. sp. avenae TaxID=200324 RepID=A0A2N5UHR5_9BASI|nr:hypothetical protein PCANC_18603 [Puccinia coronata f. sp. avenae]
MVQEMQKVAQEELQIAAEVISPVQISTSTSHAPLPLSPTIPCPNPNTRYHPHHSCIPELLHYIRFYPHLLSIRSSTPRVILSYEPSSGAPTAVFDRWSDGHCLTKARANWSDRFVRPVPAGPVQPVPGTDWTGLSDPPAVSPIELATDLKEALVDMTPTETAQLVKYWIDQLTREKEAYVASLEPSPYDLLPYKAKLSIALKRIKEQQSLDLEYQISFNNLVRSHAATRRQRYPERITPFLTSANVGSINTSTIPAVNPSCLVPNYTSKDNAPSTDGDIEANEDFLDYDLDNQSLQASSQHPHVPVNETASLTNNNAARAQAATNTTSDLAARVKAMKLPQIQRVEPPSNHSTAMEVDQSPTSSGATPSRPKPLKEDDLIIITHKDRPSNEISLLNKEDQVRVMVKDHVAIHARFLQAQKDGNTADMKSLLTQAQENQKSLQRLIPNPEIESYVKGWNSWDAKRSLFPPQTKREQEGKPKSSAYRHMKYNDQDTWAEVADIASAIRSLYKATKRG